MPLLEMKNICKSFSGVYANEDISLTVEKGEVHALLGENGAGKTTLVNILFGLYTADRGKIYWDGKEVHFDSPKEAIAQGIGMVQQHFSLIRKMTVLDNVILNMDTNAFFLDRASSEKRLLGLGEKYGLVVNPKAVVSDLSIGEQQRVEILKALFRDAKLLILDEPTGVLTPQETKQFFEVLRNLKQEGYGIIIITHRMSEIMEISDRVTILRDGREEADLVTKDTNPDELSSYMIGRKLNILEHDGKAPAQDAKMLELHHIASPRRHHGHPLFDISMEIYKGEILGLAGIEGNGQKELAEVIAGIRKASEGNILLDGKEVTHASVRNRFEQGMAYISEDRIGDSLVTGMTITENLMLRDYCREPYAHGILTDAGAMQKNAEDKIESYQVRASGKTGTTTPVRLLSGGNQQKLIIARELSGQAKLVIASQPTRGLDIGATEFVREKLIQQKKAGRSVLLISADLEEILELSDRIAVMFGGRIVGILNRADATVQKIGLLMGGITGKENAS